MIITYDLRRVIKRYLFIVLIFFGIGSSFSQVTIQSKTIGGDWNSPSTWIGGVVPTSIDDVIIDSTVYVNANVACNNLTVNAGVYLYNKYSYSITLTVNGSVINNGQILNNPSGFLMNLDVKGNISNNNLWNINSTSLSGALDQTISQATGKKFEGAFISTDSIGTIILGSNVFMNNNTWTLNRASINTNGYQLSATDYTFNNGKIESNETMVLYNTIINKMEFSGNYTFGGKVLSQGGNIFNGTCTVADTLYNRYSYTNTIQVKGNIVNKGVIANHPLGYSLYLNIAGNISNEGTWNPNTTNLVGNSDQTIQQSSGNKFEGIFNTTDSLGVIILESDVSFEGNTWTLNRAAILTNGHVLSATDYTLNDGKVKSDETMVLYNTIINKMEFSGNYTFGGKVLSQGGNIFNDTCTVADTLYNRYSYTNTIQVKGNIINKGVIANNPLGFSLYLDIAGNISNEGTWNPNTTNLVGNSDQKIQQSSGNKFEGIFNTTDSLGVIILESDVSFEGNAWTLNRATILTNGHVLSATDYTLNDGKVKSDETMVLYNTIINKMEFSGNYTFGGKVLSQGGNIFNDTCTVADTLYNRYSYTNTIQVKGNIINKGVIANNPLGFSLYLDIAGNISNEGTWNPNTTNFTGNTDQTIQQIPGKQFEGIFNTTDSIGAVVLESDVLFAGNTWNLNESGIFTNKYRFETTDYTLRNGKIISSDTLVLGNTIIESLKFFGNYKFKGKVLSQGGNVFNDTATVIDTLCNRYSYTNTILVNGTLNNKGWLINNPSGYSLSIQASGDVINDKTLEVNYLYLIGKNSRTLNGSNAFGIQSTIIVDDSIRLTGSNKIPNLSFSANSQAWCTVDSTAILSLRSLSNNDRILNFGRVSLEQVIDNTVSNSLNYYKAVIKSAAGVSMNKMIIDHYGHQQHPTSTGAVSCWWRLRNFPQNFTDTLTSLKLSYKTDALNGNLEDSLLVFHSPNAGLDWHRIKLGISIDPIKHEITVNNAPSYGHFLLAESATGIETFHPLIENAEPRFGGNSGQVTLYIYGAGFQKTSYATLSLAGQDIVADTSYLTDATGESMLARFNLNGAALGAYDVTVTTPGDTTLILPAYFSVQTGVRSSPWVALSGRNKFLLNRWQTFNMNYGNTANVDARGTIMVFVVNDLPNLELELPDTKVVLPIEISALGSDYTRIADSVGLYFTTDSLTGFEGTTMRVYPFYIPVLASGVTKNMRVKVKVTGTGSLVMDAWVMDPFFESIDLSKASDPMPVEVRACITAAAVKYFATAAVSLIPGAGCYGLVDKVVDPIGKITPGSIQPAEAENTVQSWFWGGISWASSITQCATSFMPGLGAATQLGIGLVSMVIDSKGNYDTNEACWRKFKKKSESKKDSKGVSSFDPNEIVGPQGYDTDQYISKEGELNYQIYFENKSTAGASALEVFVNDTIDKNKFDLNTFSFNTVSFGDTTLKVQNYAKEFTLLVDMYPTKAIIVQVHGKLNTLTGAISWDFHSLDRITMELVEDPDAGFLPPNVSSPEGEGNVSFSCLLKNNIAHQAVVENKASIVFDFNPPIVTNTWSNRIDTIAPESYVNSLNGTSPSNTFDVSWSGTDDGCGINNSYIFVSEDGSPFVLWKVASNQNVASFTGENGKTYSFYSIAADSIGLTEEGKQFGEATTKVVVTNVDEMEGIIEEFKIIPNPASTNCELNFNLKETDEITISIENGNGATLRIYNPQKVTVGNNKIPMDLNTLPSGMYYVRILGSKINEVHNLFVIK